MWNIGRIGDNNISKALKIFEWFEEVTFKGAFGSNNWIEGWTLLSESGLNLMLEAH